MLTYRSTPTTIIAKRLAYNTASIGTGVQIGAVPLGSMPVLVEIDVSVAFDNAAYANIGFAAGSGEWALFLDLSTVGRKVGLAYADIPVLPLNANREAWAKVFNSPTQGSAVFKVGYTG